MTMDTCSEDTHCRDPARPSCMGTLLANFYGSAAGIRPDHWSCLQTGCRARNAACAAGESCLPHVLPPANEPLDICVPNCDSNLNCPANYFCLRKLSGAAAPAVCIPGIMGFRCLSNMDCLLGDCLDTGDGFKLCATGCETDDDCARFVGARAPFMCAVDPGRRGKFCQNARAYGGALCGDDSHCRPHEACVFQSPFFGSRMQSGECRARCGPERPCADRGGVPHVCVQLGATSTCYPGRIHMPCEQDADCVGNLKCLELTAPDESPQHQPGTRRRCSLPCNTNEDCAGNRFTDGISYCAADRCTPKLHKGVPCETDGQCEDKKCQPDGQQPGAKRCA
jgi:hypothetical protein